MTAPRTCGARELERGSVALLTTIGGLLMVALGIGLVVAVTDVVAAHARAATAADAAALAAAAASPLASGDGDPRAAAHRLARRNGARLEGLDGRDWPVGVEVRVTVAIRTPVVRAWWPHVERRAAAVLRPPGCSDPPMGCSPDGMPSPKGPPTAGFEPRHTAGATVDPWNRGR